MQEEPYSKIIPFHSNHDRGLYHYLKNLTILSAKCLHLPWHLSHDTSIASAIYKCVFLDVRCDEPLWSTSHLIRGHVKFAGQLSSVPSPLRHSEYESSLVSGTYHELEAALPVNLKSTLSQCLCGLKQAISASPLKTAAQMETQWRHVCTTVPILNLSSLQSSRAQFKTASMPRSRSAQRFRASFRKKELLTCYWLV